MVYVAPHGHFERTGERLEDAFNFVVLVFSFRTYVEVHTGSITKTLEEVQEHFRGHVANILTMELSIPNKPGTSAEVESNRTEAVVHRQAVAIALNTTLVAQCLQQTFAQSEGCVFDGVVLVYMEVAAGMNGEIHHAMLTYLFKHVVEES